MKILCMEPTPARLALLEDVAYSRVFTDDEGTWLYPEGPMAWMVRRKVTARIRELENAEWVERLPGGSQWVLTDEGLVMLLGGDPEGAS